MAGLDVFRKISEEIRGIRDQDHPSVLLFSLPSEIPDRTEFLLGKGSINPGYAIAEILLKMEAAGATVAGIPCNTAHAPKILEVVTQTLASRNSKLMLVHLIEETVSQISRDFSGKNIGVLSTTGTRMTGLYRTALHQAGIEITEPETAWQERVHAAIYDESYGIKAQSCPVSEKAVSELKLAIAHLKSAGAEVILLGCTENPIAITETSIHGLPIVDANRILARRLLERNLEYQLTKAL